MLIETENAKYLREVSQGLFNLQEIINAHNTEPVKPDKALHDFYTSEKEKLCKLLEKPLVVLSIKNSDIFLLPQSFLLSNGEIKSTQEQNEKALDYLIDSLDEVQVARKQYYKSVPTMGIEEGKLKKYIDKLIKEKKLKRNREKFVENISPKAKHTITLDVPEKIEWGKVKVKFCEGDTELEIFYDNTFKGKYSFTDLGFFKGKKESFKKDNSWYFLYALSSYYKKENGATIENLANNMSELIEKKFKNDSVHHIKMTCKNKICLIFNTKEDPFIHNGKYYQTIFKLLPIPLLRNEELWSTPRREYNDNMGTEKYKDSFGDGL